MVHKRDVRARLVLFVCAFTVLVLSHGAFAAEKKALSWPDLITKMSVNPARILSLRAPGLARGSAADIVVMDPEKEYVYKRSSIESKSKNSPFIDWKLKGRVGHVFVGGRHVMKDEEIL